MKISIRTEYLSLSLSLSSYKYTRTFPARMSRTTFIAFDIASLINIVALCERRNRVGAKPENTTDIEGERKKEKERAENKEERKNIRLRRLYISFYRMRVFPSGLRMHARASWKRRAFSFLAGTWRLVIYQPSLLLCITYEWGTCPSACLLVNRIDQHNGLRLEGEERWRR